MSGGLYGRGKAPERTCLKLPFWPEQDRQVWQAACEPADILALDEGLRANHAPISNFKAAQGYGRWLTFLNFTNPDSFIEPPAERITLPRVVAYLASLQELGNSTQTQLGRLQELGEAAKVFGPHQDWTFINRLAAKVRARHQPARSKKHLKLSPELVDLGMSLMAKAQSHEGVAAALLYRDGLMITMTAYVPFRRRNIASTALERNVIPLNGIYLLSLDETETKTSNPQDNYIAEELTEPLSLYLGKYRPFLMARQGRWTKPVTNELWVSKDGSPMTEIAIYDRIRLHTGEAFGIAMNPHLFRDAAATTLAIYDPQHVKIAAPLLGHRTFATTERYYQQATAMEAHRDYVRAVFGEEEKDDEWGEENEQPRPKRSWPVRRGLGKNYP